MKKRFYPLLIFLFILGAIALRLPSIAFTETETITQQQLNDQSLLGINWVQQSGEYRALAYQAFNIGKIAFDNAKSQNITNPAVVVDLDETILNNSPYQASLIDSDEGFNNKTWNQWIFAEETLAVPGAVEFINYVNANGGKVFFVSNRGESTTKDSDNNDLEVATMKNMEKLGFTGVSDVTLLLKGEFTNNGNTDKQWRMEAISKGKADGVKHNIVIFMGDNLNDFSEIDKNSNQMRKEYVDRTQTQYGLFSTTAEGFKPAYIALPNPLYGDWENGLYDASKYGKKSILDLTPSQKTQQRKESLIKWLGGVMSNK